MQKNQTQLLTKTESARELRICVRTLENLMKARRISYIRISRAVRFEPSEIERLKKSLTVEALN